MIKNISQEDLQQQRQFQENDIIFQNKLLQGNNQKKEKYYQDQNGLNCFQQLAVKYTNLRAQIYSKNSEYSLKQRIKGLGEEYGNIEYIYGQLEDYLRYKAPICIHFKLNQDMPYFLKDTHYRNQFEVKRTRGCQNLNSRELWENNLFDFNYDKALAKDRVKYGVLNYLNNPNGVPASNQYGQSIMFLKGIRDRVTIADQDSGNVGSKKDKLQLGTLEYAIHIVQNLDESDFKELILVSLGKKEYGSYSRISQYREVQIHGEIRLQDNIEIMNINKQEFKGIEDNGVNVNDIWEYQKIIQKQFENCKVQII